ETEKERREEKHKGEKERKDK
ncbi:hypothetical protein CP02DC14_1723B, partial [Chlamydia psittaci 02DC14]